MGSSLDEYDNTPPVRLSREDQPGGVVPPLPAPVRRREPLTRYLVLFVLTAFTTTYVGAAQYAGFFLDPSAQTLPWTSWGLFVRGAWYSVPILAILGAHEFGHYYACRYYGVDASRPYFLPMPFLFTGTLGAFIRIRQQIRTKRELFDIGIAGPIAGFLVAVPVLLVGTYLSRVVAIPPDAVVGYFGEPLLVQFVVWLQFGPRAEGYDVILHPMGFAAWFGLLATALNLFPIGQLDGGHISYAVLGRKSTLVSIGAASAVVALAFVSSSWVVWAVLIVVMLVAFGPRHPRTFDEELPLDTGRKWLAAFALLMFAICFTPVPFEIIDPRSNDDRPAVSVQLPVP